MADRHLVECLSACKSILMCLVSSAPRVASSRARRQEHYFSLRTDIVHWGFPAPCNGLRRLFCVRCAILSRHHLPPVNRTSPWRVAYNETRPHSKCGRVPPASILQSPNFWNLDWYGDWAQVNVAPCGVGHAHCACRETSLASTSSVRTEIKTAPNQSSSLQFTHVSTTRSPRMRRRASGW